MFSPRDDVRLDDLEVIRFATPDGLTSGSVVLRGAEGELATIPFDGDDLVSLPFPEAVRDGLSTGDTLTIEVRDADTRAISSSATLRVVDADPKIDAALARLFLSMGERQVSLRRLLASNVLVKAGLRSAAFEILLAGLPKGTATPEDLPVLAGLYRLFEEIDDAATEGYSSSTQLGRRVAQTLKDLPADVTADWVSRD